MTEDELILTNVLKCSRSELYLRKPQLTDQQQEQFKSYKSRRKNGEPLQYILGTCNFMGFELKVDPRVLIPRPETEILVEEAVLRIKHLKNLRILDLGTGSGNIPIVLAKIFPQADITSIDISKEALELAKENLIKHTVERSIHLIQTDMTAFLKANQESLYDLIISNPPYVPEEQALPIDVKHEPTIALKAGRDGLDFYKDIIKLTPHLLRANAYLMMEFGDGQGEAIQKLAEQENKFENIEIVKDLTDRDRIIILRR